MDGTKNMSLCNNDVIVDASLPTFVAPMIALVFANRPKTLVSNEGCHVIFTTKNKREQAFGGLDGT
jgi:hypothetical protein